MPKTTRRVVVIGGGWGGATAAKYVRLEDPGIEVVMLEPNREFISCPFSNLVLSGLRTMASITHKYDGLARHGVKIIHDSATAIEADQKRVRVGDGYLEYDRLIVSPGVEFQWDQVEGLAQNQDKVLHAWNGAADRRPGRWRPCPTAASSCSPCPPSRAAARPAHTSARAR
jgi:sulfide dehydrogenase [flavocytochrome c] flavoprotein subunit